MPGDLVLGINAPQRDRGPDIGDALDVLGTPAACVLFTTGAYDTRTHDHRLAKRNHRLGHLDVITLTQG